MMADTVRDYYSSFGRREWMRLDSAEGTIEFATNCHYISTHLPAHARVLDIGGGPGRYALWLAERGHRVVLADVSPALLAIARENVSASPASEAIEAVVEADARDLSHWQDGSFDAVLSMGPFYHLTELADRECAARELLRVLRPHGTAFIALMPRYTFLRRTIALPDERPHLLQAEFLSQLLERGVFINDVPGRFTSGFGVLPDQITAFFEGHGFETLALLASEGLASGIEEPLADMAANDANAYRIALDLIIRTATDRSVLGLSNHLLYVGAKESQGSSPEVRGSGLTTR